MPEEDRATATGDLHTKFCEDQSSGSRDMLTDRQMQFCECRSSGSRDMLADRHTHTHRQTG